MGRRVLVVGAGGREHALVARLARDAGVDEVLALPGNPGMTSVARLLSGDVADPEAIARIAERERVDLVVVGPEAPLVVGAVDALAARGVAAFGPTAGAARMEGSKAFAKQVMTEAGVPTAGYVDTSDRDEAMVALDRFGPPWVVKADGLAAGKGVVVTSDRAEAEAAVDAALVHGRFGAAGARLVIEAFLDGPERSLFAVCDGRDAVLLAPAQDHKRVGDGDTGPNTGGMGAFSPVPGFALGDPRVDALRTTLILPVLDVLAARGTPFRGLLYAGLVDTASGPQLLEFNVRFGDPETQAVLPRLSSSLIDLLWAAATGGADDGVATVPVTFHATTAVTVVLAAGGYPGDYASGAEITGIEDAVAQPGVEVFHAGTARAADGRLVTAGGRVLAVTALGEDLAEARARAYGAAGLIHFDGVQRRSDVGLGPTGPH